MTLTELYKTKHPEHGTLVAWGSGSTKVEGLIIERLNHNSAFVLHSNEWKPDYKGSDLHRLYAFKEKDFHLFNAHDNLPDGYEMVGYGEGQLPEDGYDYHRLQDNSWVPRHGFVASARLQPRDIYARKPKPFKWTKDRIPTVEDTNEKGNVAYYTTNNGRKWSYVPYNYRSILGGMPWSPVSEMSQFTEHNPAPSPFGQ